MKLQLQNLRRCFAFLLALIMFVSGSGVCFADEQTAHYDLNLALTEGETFDVSTLLYESDKSYGVMLYSSDEAVASVVENSVIFANGIGVATIIVECVNPYMLDEVYSIYYIALTVKAKASESNEQNPPNQNSQNASSGSQSKSYDDVLPYCKGIAKMADERSNLKRVVYGKSVMGKPLEAYEIYNASRKNDYSSTLFIDFAVHGFEDEYYRDGKVLLKEAVRLVKYFVKHSSVLKDYRLVIVVCANPDGIFDGKNNSRANSRAFGRCTAKHVDINRDFRRFRGKETRALKKYILKSDPDVYLNCHGWENQVIGTRKLNKIVKKNLKVRRTQNEVYCYSKGFVIGWVHKKLQIPAALVEYKNTSSVSTTKDVKMIKNIIKAY